ncbi:MAG: hypothetical protein Q4D85_00150 [Corynebacterium sp.]|uniref:hypothetical protein n=1 Tax=Corynebacterium sp. TaxID=1720 RepID=UPI0026DC0A88|nr:hypothetical protein [Corynebacterium sp.]MDO5097137.1 hypothetical protein [Corynebacterium sp.]
MILFIDGPSGAGKTTLAARLHHRLRRKMPDLDVVHLDDFYPGWDGLRKGTEMVAYDVLLSTQPGFYRWDWQSNQPGQWHALNSDNLIIEGAGCLSVAGLAAASRRTEQVAAIIISGDEQLRKQRALRRDPDYAPQWQRWAEQERQHMQTVGQLVAEADDEFYQLWLSPREFFAGSNVQKPGSFVGDAQARSGMRASRIVLGNIMYPLLCMDMETASAAVCDAEILAWLHESGIIGAYE